ncbi:MAG TPA: hypothetical protein PLD47_12480, partial [Aggregatilineales bacterium]|nr:hypothetical protein [Aggregatilineales bacterium]
KIKITDAALPDVFREIEGELEEGQRALGTMFGAALRDALAEKGLELGGRPPTMTIGRFEISVDFIKRKATLSYGKEVVAKGLPLSVDGLIKAYEREQKAIINRPEDGTTWIRHLYEAWNTVRGRREGADLRANIVECYFEMVLLRQAKTFRAVPSKHSFVDYTRAQFAYDLDRYLAHQPLAYKGFQAVIHVAIKANTDNAERSVWVVSGNAPHDGRYVGDLVFQKEGK